MLVVKSIAVALIAYVLIGAGWAEIDRRRHPSRADEPFTITPLDNFLFIAALWPIWLAELFDTLW